MAAFQPIPENTNILQTTKFILTFPELPNLIYFCQTALWPSVSTSPAVVPTPFVETYRHGDKLVFDPLQLTFIVDEDMRNWEDIYIWLATLTFPEKFRMFPNRFPKKYYDAILTVNDNSNNAKVRGKFHNCHPITLGSIQFDTTTNADLTPICDLTFQYDVLSFERLNT